MSDTGLWDLLTEYQRLHAVWRSSSSDGGSVVDCEHAPAGRAPGGGYDLAADPDVRELEGRQLCLL
jgi:hypothetical protein